MRERATTVGASRADHGVEVGGPAPAERTRTVLHLEDDDATAYLFEMAIRQAGTDTKLYRVRNVDHALSFLRQDEAYAGMPRPDVIVLDIHVSGRSGFEVLTFVRSHPSLASVPIVMFSSSVDFADRARAADLGAERFLVKSIDLAGFVSAAEIALGIAR